MIKSIQHMRGTESEWDEYDLSIPDGEIAILKTKTGRRKIKVGDGSTVFSQLVSIGGDTDNGDGNNIQLKSGISYRRGELLSLKLTLPSSYDDDFYTDVSFDSGDNPTEFYISGGNVRFTGDGTADGEFMAEPNTHYTLFIWYDGSMQGVVRGIPNV